MSKNLFEQVLYTELNKDSKIPLWVHYVLRIVVQVGFGYGVYYTYMNFNYFIMIFFLFMFIYHPITLIYGEEIREWCKSYLERQGIKRLN